ncbi:hypothetical protein F52700_9302 [Fusarium sp. NRRL 52700]|nr:hypothetical protein F52700_9302 [Fusarium sp. NRRL 52700]
MSGHITTLINHISAIHCKDTKCVLLNNNEKWLTTPDDEPTITEEAQDSYWPNLEASIDSNKIQFKDLSIECDVCRTDVTIFPKDHVVDKEVGESHRAVILPCGHIFGASCVKRYFDIKSEEGSLATCIKCRAACYHPACGHPFYGEPMPCSIPGMAFTPHVVGKGGMIDHRCMPCTMARIISDISGAVKAAPDRPRAMDEFLGVVLVVGDKEYAMPESLDVMERQPMKLAYIPDSVLESFADYRERIERRENGQDFWISGYIGQWGVKLLVRPPQDEGISPGG